MKIDYWYNDGRKNQAVYADCYFYKDLLNLYSPDALVIY